MISADYWRSSQSAHSTFPSLEVDGDADNFTTKSQFLFYSISILKSFHFFHYLLMLDSLELIPTCPESGHKELMNLCGVILSVVRCGVDTMASLNQGLDPIGAELFMVRCATYYMFLNLTLCPFQ